ncbi:hypothetical protein, partial [Cupriavidus pinatubonensis]|uniref:hypothetical protein n=1 Tax=Cupriavidus pinatubonensis TaxID=248026 RepID=UPI001C62E77B
QPFADRAQMSNLRIELRGHLRCGRRLVRTLRRVLAWGTIGWRRCEHARCPGCGDGERDEK